MGVLLYFGIVLAIFFVLILCTYLMNGCKVRSPHNRRKPEDVRQPGVYVITTRTRVIANTRSANDGQNSASAPPPENPAVNEPPPDYTTVDIREFSSSRRVEAEIYPPPPSYDEAVRIES